jgi:hypothetical protein
MARTHAKKYSSKQPVEKVLVKPAVVSKERIATEVPAGTEGAIPIRQEDGSEKFFVVSSKVVTPEVVKYIAIRPTTTRGACNDTKNMAPKGTKGAAPLMRKKGT